MICTRPMDHGGPGGPGGPAGAPTGADRGPPGFAMRGPPPGFAMRGPAARGPAVRGAGDFQARRLPVYNDARQRIRCKHWMGQCGQGRFADCRACNNAGVGGTYKCPYRECYYMHPPAPAPVPAPVPAPAPDARMAQLEAALAAEKERAMMEKERAVTELAAEKERAMTELAAEKERAMAERVALEQATPEVIQQEIIKLKAAQEEANIEFMASKKRLERAKRLESLLQEHEQDAARDVEGEYKEAVDALEPYVVPVREQHITWLFNNNCSDPLYVRNHWSSMHQNDCVFLEEQYKVFQVDPSAHTIVHTFSRENGKLVEFEHQVDFRTMTQTNMNAKHGTVREIQRSDEKVQPMKPVLAKKVPVETLQDLALACINKELSKELEPALETQVVDIGYAQIPIDKKHVLHDIVQTWFQQSDPDCIFLYTLKVDRIKLIKNPVLGDVFLAANGKRAKKLLIHGTNPMNLHSICQDGLAYRYTWDSYNHLYGKGNYWSKDGSYSVQKKYCPEDHDGFHKLLLCIVATGTEYDAAGVKNPDLKKSPVGCDCVVSDRDGCTMYVTYNDTQATVVAEVWCKKVFY